MITDSEQQLQEQIDTLRADVQRLRDQLAGAVGLPSPGTAGQVLLTDSALPYWGDYVSPIGTITYNRLSWSIGPGVLGISGNSFGQIDLISAPLNDRILGRVSNALSWTQVTAGMVPNDLVSNAMLRNSLALSVVGRSANSVGDPADIAATSTSGDSLYTENSALVFDSWVRQRRNIMRGFWEFETGGSSDPNQTIYGTPFKAATSGTAAVSSASRFTNTNANSCVIIANSAAGYAGFYSDYSAGACGIPFTLGVATVEFGVTLQGGLSSVGQEYRDMFGCIDVVTGTPVYGVWFEYDRVTAGHFWRICARNGGATTKTTTASAVANGTPYRLRFEVTSASNVNFYVNGTYVGSVTTNIPSVGNLGASMYRISGTNNIFADIDYVAYQVLLTTPRAASSR